VLNFITQSSNTHDTYQEGMSSLTHPFVLHEPITSIYQQERLGMGVFMTVEELTN